MTIYSENWVSSKSVLTIDLLVDIQKIIKEDRHSELLIEYDESTCLITENRYLIVPNLLQRESP